MYTIVDAAGIVNGEAGGEDSSAGKADVSRVSGAELVQCSRCGSKCGSAGCKGSPFTGIGLDWIGLGATGASHDVTGDTLQEQQAPRAKCRTCPQQSTPKWSVLTIRLQAGPYHRLPPGPSKPPLAAPHQAHCSTVPVGTDTYAEGGARHSGRVATSEVP